MSNEYKSKRGQRRPRFWEPGWPYRGEHRMHSGRRHWWQPRPDAVVIPLPVRSHDDTLAIIRFDDATTDVIHLAEAS